MNTRCSWSVEIKTKKNDKEETLVDIYKDGKPIITLTKIEALRLAHLIYREVE